MTSEPMYDYMLNSKPKMKDPSLREKRETLELGDKDRKSLHKSRRHKKLLKQKPLPPLPSEIEEEETRRNLTKAQIEHLDQLLSRAFLADLEYPAMSVNVKKVHQQPSMASIGHSSTSSGSRMTPISTSSADDYRHNYPFSSYNSVKLSKSGSNLSTTSYGSSLSLKSKDSQGSLGSHLSGQSPTINGGGARNNTFPLRKELDRMAKEDSPVSYKLRSYSSTSSLGPVGSGSNLNFKRTLDPKAQATTTNNNTTITNFSTFNSTPSNSSPSSSAPILPTITGLGSFAPATQTSGQSTSPSLNLSFFPPLLAEPLNFSEVEMEPTDNFVSLKGSKSWGDLPKDQSPANRTNSPRSISTGNTISQSLNSPNHGSTAPDPTTSPVISSPNLSSSSKSAQQHTSSLTPVPTPNATPLLSQSACFSPLSPSTNLVPRSRNVSGQQHVLYPNPMSAISFRATDPAEWSLDRVLMWLEYNKFGPDWIETFRARNIHGTEFLSLVSYTKLKKDLGKELGQLSTSNDMYSTTPSRFIQILRKVLDKSSSNTSQHSGNDGDVISARERINAAARESGIWHKDEDSFEGPSAYFSYTHDGFHSNSICAEHPVHLAPGQLHQTHHAAAAAAVAAVTASNNLGGINNSTPNASSSSPSPLQTVDPGANFVSISSAYSISSGPSSAATADTTSSNPISSNTTLIPPTVNTTTTTGMMRLPVQKYISYDDISKEIDPSQIRVRSRSRSKNKSDPQILHSQSNHPQQKQHCHSLPQTSNLNFQHPYANQLRAASTSEGVTPVPSAVASSSFPSQKYQVWNCFPVRRSKHINW